MGLEAAIGGGILSNVATGLINSSATGDATAAQLAANDKTLAFQKDQAAKAEKFLREQTALARQDLQPFRDSQLAATQQLQGLADPNSELFQQQRSINTQAIQRQLAAQGLLRSRNQSDLLSNLEIGLNQSRAGILGQLSGMGAAQGQAGIAQGLGGSLNSLYQNTTEGIGSSLQNVGRLQAGGILGQAQALTGMIGGINNSIQGGIGSFMQQQQNQGLLDLYKQQFGQ